jgi:parvulin-like peptidyl-prolyl isomerase
VMAKVNNYIITLQELRGSMIQLSRSTTMSEQQLREEVLNILIDNKLILSDYENSGFAIPDSYFEDLFDQNIKDRFPDRVSFVKTLQSEGKHLDEVRKEFKEQTIINIMASQKIGQQISISPYKIERYYEDHKEDYLLKNRVNLRMIIIPSKGTSDPEAIAKAEMIHEKILEGGTFADLARQYSTGVQAKEGGLMGWADRDEMRKEIAAVAFEMEVGETSNLIKTPNAIFIVRVEEKEDEHVQALSEVRDAIERDLRGEQTAARRKQWIDGLRKKSFVRTF